ncbi:coiled-coil domain-containing protein 175 isoform X1 [Scyliorhinus canicula]|uniref:coiled-coil domain-containing protein 175 isoform X1 n=2 Tax=Scyliorhinus canicula TaxID=7830 RepID=UPI0018F4D15B|nr:coiled-coil domain-containing protein 175 isoform X1 [Scyliorhinus canicula]
MKTQKVCFGRETVRHFRQIVEGVTQLEEVRRGVHDVLEVETIKASKLRHKLTLLPNKLNQQIADAVAAAHESKAAHVKELQAKIETMAQQIETLKKEYNRLERENVSLCPTQQKAGAQYDRYVSQLNEVMEKRTSDQITLNETYDNIRDTQQKIIVVTRDIAELKEEISEEQKVFQAKKEILTAKFTEIYYLVQNQNALNFEKKNQVDELNLKLTKLNQNLSVQEEINALLKAQNKTLEREENNLQTKFIEESKIAGELETRKQNIMDELSNLIADLRRKAADFRARIQQADKDTENAKALNQNLNEKKESRHEAFMAAKEYEVEVKQNFNSLENRLNAVKDMLTLNEEEVSQMRRQIQEFEEKIMAVMEKHKDAMDFLNGELQKYAHKFEKEQQLRKSIQQKREEISKDIMHIKATTEDYLTHLSMRMKDLKKKRDKLILEIKRLQKEIRIYSEKTVALKRQIAEAKAKYGNSVKLLSTEIRQLKKEIDRLNETIKAVKEELQEKMSTHQTLESMLAAETTLCNELQKESEEQRKVKYELDNTIAQLRTKIAVLLSSKSGTKALLSAIRNSLYHQVINTVEQLKSMEADIYEASRRLEHVEIENCKLKLCNFHLVKTIASFNEQEEKQNAAKKQQDAELQIIYGNLLKSWALDNRVLKEYEACEQSVLDVINDVLKKIHYRKRKTGSIRDHLKECLSKMQSFVGTTSSIEESREKCMEQTKSLQ